MKKSKISKADKLEFPSELRYDLISKDWVIIATGRAKRPEMFKKEKRIKQEVSKKVCPFCHITSDDKPILVFSHGKEVQKGAEQKDWTVIVVPNKFPAFLPSNKLEERMEDKLYKAMNAVGFHEVIITRDHKRQMAQFSIAQLKEVIDVFQKRYLQLMNQKFVKYISIFHNHGVEAGASIAHPHSQIITTPLIDPDLRRALWHSKRYFRKHKKCIYCEANKWEQKEKTRIVFENKEFLVICPFASRVAFEMVISPKKHLSYFEQITETQKWQLAEAFKMALGKLYKALGDPPYNFYLHTAPCDRKNYNFYHWHFTILPKTSVWAGFELGTKMEISTIEPEKAAEYLRKQKV